MCDLYTFPYSLPFYNTKGFPLIFLHYETSFFGSLICMLICSVTFEIMRIICLYLCASADPIIKDEPESKRKKRCWLGTAVISPVLLVIICKFSFILSFVSTTQSRVMYLFVWCSLKTEEQKLMMKVTIIPLDFKYYA